MRNACSLVCGAAALVSVQVWAQPQLAGPALSWDAPVGCPQVDEVRARIEAIAGSAVKKETRLQARASITRADGRFHLRLVLREGDLQGERNITSDSCEDLAGATAVALGLMLRSETPLTESTLRGARDAPNADSPAQAAEPAPPAPDSQGVETRASSSSSSRHWRALVQAPVIVGELGPLSEPSLGLALGVGGRYDDWRFLLSAQLWLTQTVHGADLPDHGARLGRQAAALTIGRAFRVGRGELAPGLRLALERISARGTGAGVEPSDAQAVWLGVGAGVQGSLAVAQALAVFADIGARIEISRPLLAIDGLGNVAQLGPVALGAGLGLEWSF